MKRCSSLEELHLSMNDYDTVNLETVEAAANKYSSLKILHFTGNPVTNWNEVSKLGAAFPKLEALVLAECKLVSLNVASDNDESMPMGRESVSESDHSDDSPHNQFRNLKVLNLNHTLLTSWEDIEKLAKFPALRSVRLQGCPLFEVKVL